MKTAILFGEEHPKAFSRDTHRHDTYLNSGEGHAQALVEVEVEEPLLLPTPRVQIRECTESQIPEVLE